MRASNRKKVGTGVFMAAVWAENTEWFTLGNA